MQKCGGAVCPFKFAALPLFGVYFQEYFLVNCLSTCNVFGVQLGYFLYCISLLLWFDCWCSNSIHCWMNTAKQTENEYELMNMKQQAVVRSTTNLAPVLRCSKRPKTAILLQSQSLAVAAPDHKIRQCIQRSASFPGRADWRAIRWKREAPGVVGVLGRWCLSPAP